MDPQATHNCWAWRINFQVRSSDDGEPSGTAGRPMLNVIERRQLENVMVVVTRYFGGIKLGVGGLVTGLFRYNGQMPGQGPYDRIISHVGVHHQNRI